MKIVKVLTVSLLLVTGIVSKSFAGSAEFGGPYIGVHGTAIGFAIDGKHTDANLGGLKVTKGTAGAVGATAGVEIGYNIPITDAVFISVSGNHTPVDASFKADATGNVDDVKVTIKDINEFSIEPSISLSDNTAVFIKASHSEFSISASGTGLDKSQSFDLSGETFALGTKTITDSGFFAKTEAGITSWDSFKLIGVGTSDGTVTADVDSVYGRFTIGRKF